MTQLVAYHNDPALKDQVLKNLDAHSKADEIVQGQYWKYGRGCSIACILVDFDQKAAVEGNHSRCAELFGGNETIYHLQDTIFEGLEKDIAQTWPKRFMSAIKPGSDLSMVWSKFAYWLLTEEITRNLDKENHKNQLNAIEQVANLYKEHIETGEPIDQQKARDASDAVSAYADDDAVYTAYTAYAAADAATSAAYAAYAAAYATSAYASAYAANSAAYAADAAAYDDAYTAGAAYSRMADKLIELLKEA